MSIRAQRVLFLGSLLLIAVLLLGLAYVPRRVELTSLLATPPPAGHLVTVRQPDQAGCYMSGTSGILVKDATYLTAFSAWGGAPQPVAWPEGYSARLSGSEVEVLGTTGTIVATTGRKGYVLPMGSAQLPPGFNGFAICAVALEPGPS